MRKLFYLIIPTLMMMGCVQSAIDEVTAPELVSLYQESLTLKSVAPDSVNRFASKVKGYVQLHPAAKEDPMYEDIMENINCIVRFNIVVAGFEEVPVQAEF